MKTKEPLRGSTTPRDAAKTEERRLHPSQGCLRCNGALELLSPVESMGPEVWRCRECNWRFKKCVACPRLIEQAQLSAEESERCDDCADVTEVDDGDADLPVAWVLVWPEGTPAGRFTSAYGDEAIAKQMAERLGARAVPFIPEARPVDLTPLLRTVQRLGFGAIVEGALTSLAANRARDIIANLRRKARDERGLCRSSLAHEDCTHDCSLADGHDGEHKSTDGTTWPYGPFARNGAAAAAR